MEKIFLLGGKSTLQSVQLGSPLDFCSVENFVLESDAQIHDFLIKRLSDSKFKAILVDLDDDNPELMLRIAMTIRLSYVFLKEVALLPIVFVSVLPFELFVKYDRQYSQLLIAGQGSYFSDLTNLESVLQHVAPISYSDYIHRFLPAIHIVPGEKQGRHSLANQWGASVLASMTNTSVDDIETVRDAEKSLYFKYCKSINCNSESDQALISNSVNDLKVISKNKRILLIDDEADNGWESVIRQLMPNALIDVVKEQISDLQDIPNSIAGKLNESLYDLVLLDLRLNAEDEEDIIDTENISGFKVLKGIKDQNPGTQVIIMTASNKAWNLQNLVKAKCNGYYIKESPEFGYSKKFSLQNANTLIDNIIDSIRSCELRFIYWGLKKIAAASRLYKPSFSENVKINVDIAFELLYLAYSNVRNKDFFDKYLGYSYLQIFQIIEAFLKLDSVFVKEHNNYYVIGNEAKHLVLEEFYDEHGKKYFNCPMKYVKASNEFEIGIEPYSLRVDTNFKMSAVMIFRFGHASPGCKWKDIRDNRNTKTAHDSANAISEKNITDIIDFVCEIFTKPADDKNYRYSLSYKESMKEKVERLKNKFPRK